MSKSVQQHVVRLDVTVDETHGMYGVQGHHDLRCIELGPFLWHVVGAGKVDQVTPWHVLHYHVEVVLILEGTAQLNKAVQYSYYTRNRQYLLSKNMIIKKSYSTNLHDPGTVGKGHDVSLFPEKGRIRSLDHFKLAQQLHGINLLRGFMSHLQDET